MTGRGRDRRGEPRGPASGTVEFFVSDPIPLQFQGELQDISKSGFRASHQNRELQPGVQIRYRHAEKKGLARVVWTRIIADRVDTGFLLL